MPDFEQEQRHLAQVERTIAEGDRRIADLEANIAALQAFGGDTAVMEAGLVTMRSLMQTYEDLRRQILGIIDDMRVANPFSRNGVRPGQ